MKREAESLSQNRLQSIRRPSEAVGNYRLPGLDGLGAPSYRCFGIGSKPNAMVGRGTTVPLGLLPLLLWFASVTMAQEHVRLDCAPRTLQVVPGEPVRLSVQANSAAPIRLIDEQTKYLPGHAPRSSSWTPRGAPHHVSAHRVRHQRPSPEQRHAGC